MNLLILFIALNIVNVIMQTIKSIATVKGGKMLASVVNAITYGLYTVVIIYTVCDLPLWQKVAIVALANFLGVYVVKYLEEKLRKDKLWKIEFTCPCEHTEAISKLLLNTHIPFSIVNTQSLTAKNNQYDIFCTYCATQVQSKAVAKVAQQYNCKSFVTEQSAQL